MLIAKQDIGKFISSVVLWQLTNDCNLPPKQLQQKDKRALPGNFYLLNTFCFPATYRVSVSYLTRFLPLS
jgi:hypothetical protein